MDEFKKVVDGLLIKSIEEIMLQTGMEKYDILKMARKCGYKICVGGPSVFIEKPAYKREKTRLKRVRWQRIGSKKP